MKKRLWLEAQTARLPSGASEARTKKRVATYNLRIIERVSVLASLAPEADEPSALPARTLF